MAPDIAEEPEAIPSGRRPLFDTLRERKLSDDECFLCGVTLDAANRSDEHVIPRWAQERFDLWNQRLGLLNGTTIPYRQLTIPCCIGCNTCALQPIESAMAEATLAGPEAVCALGPRVIFNWLGKIFYGLVHRELFLALNRRDPQAGSIATPELIHSFSVHHLLLQNARLPMEFTDGFPASLLTYETLEPPDRRAAWDFRDSISSLFISVRIGRVGLIGVLQDGGVQEAMARDKLADHLQFPLHPLQHSELAAKIAYKSVLTQQAPKYLVMEGPGQPIRVMQFVSGEVRFDDWDNSQYARGLAAFAQVPVESIYDPETDSVRTWLRRDDGSPNVIDPETAWEPKPSDPVS